MKKLLMALTVALVAIGVNAATVNWQVSLGWVTESDTDADTTLAGYIGYMFDGNAYTQAALQTALTTTGATELSSALGHSAVTADGMLDFSGSGLYYDNTADPAWAKALLVIVDSAADINSLFMITSLADVKVTDAVAAGGAIFGDGGDLYTGSTSSWSKISSSAVPEPTSGLLMLLGMAGLALRRKRA